MSSTVYRKTEEGRAELGNRRGGLSPATRQVLILINGSDSAAVLAGKLGEVRGHLDALLALGLIEEVPSSRPGSTVGRATSTPATPAAPSAPAPAPAPEQDPRLLELQRRAYRKLQPHFGADTPIVAQAMLAARTLADFRRSLVAIEAKLAIYMGRKQAALEVESLMGEL